MKLERNTVIGFIVLALLFFGYFYYTRLEQATFRKEQARVDSIAKANQPKQDPALAHADSLRADSIGRITNAGDFQTAANGTEQLTTAENDLFRIVFTNKGGQPKKIELKHFKNLDSGLVTLAGTPFDQLSYTINTANNRSAKTADLYFQPGQLKKNADGSTTVSFVLQAGDSAGNSSIVHAYTIRPGKYMVDWDLTLNGADKLLSNGQMNLSWQYASLQQESDIKFEKQNTQVGFVDKDGFDYFTIGNRSDAGLSGPVKWVGVRQRFFNSYLVANDNFTGGKMEWTMPPDSERMIVKTVSTMQAKLPVASTAKTSFRIFYGPADYKILREYKELDLDKLINLGQGMYAFVRPINKYVILPFWDFIKSFVSNYGWVIAFLTIFIRLITSPLIYRSYLSGAKMKALRPEISKLKEKFGADQQAMSMEQMKLFREAGVNPLGGCLPALLQIPIFFALYSFFSAEVDLRGASFLWAKDLSAFDSIVNFGFSVPLLGSHLSLFTILAVVTSLLISVYSMSMTPDQNNPMLKYMPYIFPIFLLFIFNSLPSALTWYYTVSNVITLILQFVIQNYIIDHDKILVKINENRKKPKSKSKWQERMEQMQEQQKKLKEMQQKSKK